MTEETIFAEALEKSTPVERTAYLDKVCAEDPVLRHRIETLLKSHDADGNFLGKPAIQCAAEEFAGQACTGDTQGVPPSGDDGVEVLDFLTPSDKPGSLGRLGHYEVLEIIGRGGMGIVLRAIDEKLQRVVAIKVMAAQLATNANARKRFFRESRAAAAVTHDHIVTIHAVEVANGLPYLVMQFVSGVSLQQRLDRSGPLELREIVRIGMQTAAGLTAAHTHGLIHRDIKPANILLENGVERVKITDFGLARAVADASLTQSGVVTGTPQYMSPEQSRGEAVDQRTDLFSLGSVLYAMCTGRPPFRADSNMAVLKRVCDDTPSAIRETNPEIPDWLVAIVTKLHAKNPAERFPSVVEVAELLKIHLAQLQHPSVVGPAAGNHTAPASRPGGESIRGQPAPHRRRRWAMAAAVLLLCVGAGLGFTEATGVTNLLATVIRIPTPEGTLIVEVDDPGVKVTIEGDGGIVITGAGLQEVRLKPGSYKVHADKDGKRIPLEKEVVSIAKNGREVVRVKLEPTAAPVALKGEKGAFVLLAAGKERRFNILAEAVQGASDGDTIEIRGNGPFVSAPINIRERALTIRAGTGYRPVIRNRPEGLGDDAHLLQVSAHLVLEGLELHVSRKKVHSSIIQTDSAAPLFITNCRLVGDGLAHCIWAGTWPTSLPVTVEIRNSELYTTHGHGVVVVANENDAMSRLDLDNCVQAGLHALTTAVYQPGSRKISLRVARSTFVGGDFPLQVWAMRAPEVYAPLTAPCITVNASENIFDGEEGLFLFDQSHEAVKDAKPLPLPEARKLLSRLVEWREDQNVVGAETKLLAWRTWAPGDPVSLGHLATVEEWDRFWGVKDTKSVMGRARFQLDNIRKMPVAQITPADFRIRPGSPGYRAGRVGRDLGADVDLVGPGPPYDRWRKTPAYQQWLKDSGQMKK